MFYNQRKRNSDVEECVNNCNSLVIRIFKELNPTLYIPVGSSCARYIFGMRGSITRQSGYPLEDKDNVIPIIHPASLLYSHNPQTEAKFQCSLERIKKYLDNY